MPDKIQYSSRAGKALVDMFAEYAALNPRELPELMKKQGGELAGNLYRLTPAANKTDIQQKLDSLGARFKRAPRAFALKVGPKARAFFKANATKAEKKARAGRNKAKKLNRIKGTLSRGQELPDVVHTDGLRKGLTLTEEKFAALRLRMSRRGALAASWVPALRKLGSKMKVAAAAAGKSNEYPQSEALFYGNPESITVDIINTAPGIAKENDKTHFVDSALDATTKNMQEYRDRKVAEMAIRFRRAAAESNS